ncbi:MAG: InlB B-repeat-containing protein [Lachnospiraceae bacterium]|nr:InlB B-repeat-containing protein [Lachnospiraceae bacterium]
MGTIPKNKKIFLIQVFAIPTLICILFCMEWMRAYAADVRPSEVAAGETFNAGYTGVTNCALRIRFYRYKDDAESRLNYSLSNPYESEVKGYDQYDSGEDVTAPSIDGSTNGVKWHKYGEGETSDLDRNYYYDVTYYAELPIVINFDQNYQTSPDHYDSPIMCASSGVFANPSDKVEVTLNPALTREGYSFLGWSKNEEAQTADYAAGSKYRVGVNERNQLMYAVWQRKPVNVTVQYSPNGGTGDTINKSISVTLSDDVSGNFALLDRAAFKRENYKLTGWSDEDGTIYDLGSKYGFMVPNTETTAFFSFDAVWTEKTAGEVDIDVKKPVYVGAEFKYDIDKNSDGDVKLEYKKKGAKDDDYTKKVPTEPGKYTVRATLEETDDYTSAEDTTDFDISYLSAPDAPYSYQEIKNSAGTVTDLKIVPAEGYSIGLTGAVDASFGSSVLYSAAKKAGGVYLKRDDGAITEQVQLTEYSVKDTPSITVNEKVYYGEKFSVTASSKSPADKTITYAKAGSSNSSFTSTVPTEPGKYTVRLTAPASGFYAAVDEKRILR